MQIICLNIQTECFALFAKFTSKIKYNKLEYDPISLVSCSRFKMTAYDSLIRQTQQHRLNKLYLIITSYNN